MTKKIFRSTLLVAVCALLASLVLIMGCLYDYFAGLQSQALRDELTLAASGVSQGGETYLDTIDSNRYRLTWIAPDGTVLYDTQADASTMENHAAREEVRQALAAGEGESSRYSQTLLEKTMGACSASASRGRRSRCCCLAWSSRCWSFCSPL